MMAFAAVHVIAAAVFLYEDSTSWTRLFENQIVQVCHHTEIKSNEIF